MRDFTMSILAIVALVSLLFILKSCEKDRLAKYYPEITWYDVLFYGDKIKIEPDGR